MNRIIMSISVCYVLCISSSSDTKSGDTRLEGGEVEADTLHNSSWT